MTLQDDVVDTVTVNFDDDGNAFLKQGDDVIALSEGQQIKLISAIHSYIPRNLNAA